MMSRPVSGGLHDLLGDKRRTGSLGQLAVHEQDLYGIVY
jgi:hypothetical protein